MNISNLERTDARHLRAAEREVSVNATKLGGASLTWDIVSRVLLMEFRRAVSGSTSIMPCRVYVKALIKPIPGARRLTGFGPG